jgi:polyribonucleotide nucleotidyltransferase
MKSETISLAGTEIAVETGAIARQADAAVIVRQGETMILATVVGARTAREGIDFFPLTVDYREGKWAAGKFPGGFLKREARSTDHEVLTCRLADRSIRPLFPDGYRNETQVIITTLSCAPDIDPSVLTLIGVPLALHISDIPWNGPAAGIRVARVDSTLVVNPTQSQRARADLELVVSSGPDGLSMVEGEAREVPEAEVAQALFFAQDAVAPALELMNRWRGELGREKRAFRPPAVNEALAGELEALAAARLREAVCTPVKQERGRAVERVREETLAALCPDNDPQRTAEVAALFSELHHQVVRRMIAREGVRIDGRPLDQVRPISCQVGWLPRTHGSAVFTRGETQAMVITTLGTTRDRQVVETLFGDEHHSFLLHYSFPPYSVGETRPVRGPGRREIGHGNLARRALQPVLPDEDAFPYAIRVVSEISESNGSSSMATVCGGCLALMDAGVPISSPVAGIAMGLIQEDGEIHVLTDILGDEDHLGDMDFKVTGTATGVTALQMDNKVGGLDRTILDKALTQARTARLHILAEMARTLAGPREQLSDNAPRVMSHRINPARIRDLIGKGGKTIQEIQETYKAKIDISDDGLVRLYAEDGVLGSQAMARIRRITDDPEVGKVYRGEVVSVKDFGAFVKIMDSTEGLVHISELDQDRVDRASDVVHEGEKILVRVLGVDDRGKLKLSRRDALGVSEAEVDE